MSHSSDVWDNVALLAHKTTKRKFDESTSSHGNWEDFAKHAALTNLLDGAVSHPNIELRKTYVQRIMQLPGETQRSLMALIERQKKAESSGRRDKKVKTAHAPDEQTNTPSKQRSVPKSSSARKNGRSPFTPRTTHSKRSSMTPGTRGRSLFSTPRRIFAESSPQVPPPGEQMGTSGFLSPGLGDTAEYEKEVQGLREQNEELRRHAENYRRKEEDMKAQLEDMESTFRNEMMKVEASCREREDETRERLEAKIKALETDLHDMSEHSDAAEHAKAELARVKDEMELMMHTKSLLDDTTERLNMYKEKLQQLTDVKEALHREEEAHSRSVDENLRLQNELNVLQPLKRQLDDYKSRAVEAEVALTETQDELQKLKLRCQNSSDSHENLTKTVLSQQEEIESLLRRIKHEEDEQTQGAGLGEGISEMNPEVKEELLKLRNENTQLKEFADKREDDAVTKLELEVADAQRLSERYKSQFLSTKGTLETALLDFQESVGREENLQRKLAGAAVELNDCHLQLEERAQQMARSNANLDASRTRESKLEEELCSWVEQARNLQERADDMTRRLQQCSEDLEESLDRESELKDSLSSWVGKHDECTTQISSLTEDLKVRSRELHETQTLAEDLAHDMAEWIEKAKSASELANDISDQLKACSEELNQSRNISTVMQKAFDEVSQTLKMKEHNLDDMEERLLHVKVELEDRELELASATDHEIKLQNDLLTMSNRAKTAETVSKQTIHKLEVVKEELINSETIVKTLTERGDLLVSEVESLNDRSEKKNEELEALQGELENTNAMITETRCQLVETTEQMNVLRVRSASLENELCESKEKLALSDTRTTQLQQEVSSANHSLLEKDRSLALAQSIETSLKDQLLQSNDLTLKLEGSVEEERRSRVQVEDALATVCHANEEMEAELKGRIEILTSKLDEEKRIASNLENDLKRTQEALHEAEGALGAAQHREKMLHHKNGMLEDRERELQNEVEAERARVDHKTKEAIDSLEATREALNLKAIKDMQDLQDHMNQLLEEERSAKRQAEEASQETMKKLQEDFKNEISVLRSNASKENDAVREDATERCQKMKTEYDEKIARTNAEADEESTKLVRKGKSMLKELKAQQQLEIEKLSEEISTLEERYRLVKSENESVTKQFKAKASEYKKKLHFASGRISRLTEESDEIEGKIAGLEREKFKLREENDRYRRQLGGRFGSDSNGQNQLETLQKELKSACDEIRELKRQQKGGSYMAPIDEGPESADHSYSRDVANHSTISQLRSDYEETIEALNDEKRELVMRNSAAITDIQKAEKRAWESEQENSALQQELTSLQLQVERLGTMQELANTRDPALSRHPEFEDESNARLSTLEEGILSRSQTQDDPRLTSSVPPSQDVDNDIERSPMPFALGNEPGEEIPPECQQS